MSYSACGKEKVQRACADYGFIVDDVQAENLSIYLNLLMQWNTVINLVGTRSWVKTLSSLILDSFYLAEFISEDARHNSADNHETWDLGAGAGIPGIPLRFLWQEGSYWMIESRDKRSAFLSTVLARCNVHDTHVFHGRVENFIKRRNPSLIISRAFMPWQKILQLFSNERYAGCECILLTNEPVKMTENPAWHHYRQKTYTIEGNKRYFYSLLHA